MKLGPINVAAVTPHRAGYEADLAATLELLDFLCSHGAQGIALLGSTGEFLHLSLEDRAHLVKLAVKRSRAPVLAGVTHSTLDGTVRLAEEAARSDAAGALVMPPYFYPYEAGEVREFYLRLADRLAGALPLYLYNIPQFTSAIPVELACELLASGKFAGIKDSSGSFDDFLKLSAQKTSAPFTLLVGNDRIYARARCAGADGIVSGVASAVPELLLSLDRAIQSGDTTGARRFDLWLQEFLDWLDRFPPPVGVIAAASARGVKVGSLAVPLSEEKRATLTHFQAWLHDWLPTVLRECGGKK